MVGVTVEQAAILAALKVEHRAVMPHQARNVSADKHFLVKSLRG